VFNQEDLIIMALIALVAGLIGSALGYDMSHLLEIYRE